MEPGEQEQEQIQEAVRAGRTEFVVKWVGGREIGGGLRRQVSRRACSSEGEIWHQFYKKKKCMMGIQVKNPFLVESIVEMFTKKKKRKTKNHLIGLNSTTSM